MREGDQYSVYEYYPRVNSNRETLVTILTEQGHGYDFLVSRSPFIVGRAAQADLHIPAPEVSTAHFQMEVEGAQVVLTDLDSKNGTVVSGKPLRPNKPARLSPPFAVSLGAVELRIWQREVEEPSLSLSLERSHSMSRLILNSIMRARFAQSRAKLAVQAGLSQGAELVMDEGDEVVLIGTTPEAQLFVDEDALSEHPVVLSLVGCSYFVAPHPSRKLTVNGRRVSHSTRLSDGVELCIGATQIRFTDPLQSAVDKMELETGVSPEQAAAEAGAGEKRPWTRSELWMMVVSIAVMVFSILTILVVLEVIEF